MIFYSNLQLELIIFSDFKILCWKELFSINIIKFFHLNVEKSSRDEKSIANISISAIKIEAISFPSTQ